MFCVMYKFILRCFSEYKLLVIDSFFQKNLHAVDEEKPMIEILLRHEVT